MIFFSDDLFNSFRRKKETDGFRQAFDARKKMHDKMREQYINEHKRREAEGQARETNRTYGTNPLEWIQTKPQPVKQFRLKGLQWKKQFEPKDVIVIDMIHITAQDLIIFKVPGIFEYVFDCSGISNIHMVRPFELRLPEDRRIAWVNEMIKRQLLPEPMEVLVTTSSVTFKI